MTAVTSSLLHEQEFYAGPVRHGRLFNGNEARNPYLAFITTRIEDTDSLFADMDRLFSPDTAISVNARFEHARRIILDALHDNEAFRLVGDILEEPGMRQELRRMDIAPALLLPGAKRMVQGRTQNPFPDRASIHAFMAKLDETAIPEGQKERLRRRIPVLLGDWSDVQMQHDAVMVVLTGNMEKAIDIADALALIAGGFGKGFRAAWQGAHPQP